MAEEIVWSVASSMAESEHRSPVVLNTEGGKDCTVEDIDKVQN